MNLNSIRHWRSFRSLSTLYLLPLLTVCILTKIQHKSWLIHCNWKLMTTNKTDRVPIWFHWLCHMLYINVNGPAKCRYLGPTPRKRYLLFQEHWMEWCAEKPKRCSYLDFGSVRNLYLDFFVFKQALRLTWNGPWGRGSSVLGSVHGTPFIRLLFLLGFSAFCECF